ncbi:hypothetical protein [Streptomyces albogriseolus]|uniref:hypothetical protein n=1 Tax=Streptomyces albogriseolus TaxID=1887 RepID=UPI0033A12E51
MAERVRVREIDGDEGQRLLRIVRRGSGSVVTWRRAQMVLLSARAMPVAIAEVTFTSADRIRDVIDNFNADGFASLHLKCKGGRPRTFTLPERREIKKIAKSRPAGHGLPFSTWSLAELAGFLVAGGGRRYQLRGPSHPAPRGGRVVSTHKGLEDLPRSRLRRHEGPCRTPLRDRRRRGHTRGR